MRCIKDFAHTQLFTEEQNYWIIPKSYMYDPLFDSIDGNAIGILKQLFGSKVEVVLNDD